MQSPTQELLETEPLKYLELIKTMNEFDEVNDTTYYSWYSNHAQSLSYITGTLELEFEQNENFYGCKIQNLDENISIEILDNLVRLGADLYKTNYYQEDILESLNNNMLFKRSNNEKFIEKVIEYYNNNNEYYNN